MRAFQVKKKVQCGNVYIGGGAPVSIQSMLSVSTADVPSALLQLSALKESGCDIVRLAVPDIEAAEAFGRIKKEQSKRYGDKAMPLVADIHFDYRLALAALKNGADKIRINPGNIGETGHVKSIADASKERGVPIRIGVNSGSLEKDIIEKYGGVTAAGLAESALRNIKLIEDMDFDNIVVSIKAADVRMNYEAAKLLYEKTDHPLHIGITEAGPLKSGKIKSAVGLGALLLLGIGDTVRVSLTGDPVEEVLCAKEILLAAGLRNSGINIISCPACGRTKTDLAKIVGELSEKLEPIKKRREALGMKGLSVAAMGCIVNGPGEAKQADFGIAFGDGKGAVFAGGKIIAAVPEDRTVDELIRLIEKSREHV